MSKKRLTLIKGRDKVYKNKNCVEKEEYLCNIFREHCEVVKAV